MEFMHSLQQATGYAELAHRLMSERRIVPHPNNYTLWYGYAADRPDLRIALDALMRGNAVFDEDRNRNLFEAFCSTAPAAAVSLHHMAEGLEREIAAVTEALACAGTNARDYTAALESTLGEAAKPQQNDQRLVAMFVGLLSRTRVMAQQSRDVEQRLEAAAKETKALKRELDNVRQQALTDPLTGLANRTRFDNTLLEETIAAGSAGTPLSLLLIDIDSFKKFNDDYGHVVGDQVLRLLGFVLKENLKGRDLAARFGGEEFSVILPDTSPCDARRLADNIRRKVADRRLVNRQTGEKLATITVSIGIAGFIPGESVTRLVERADKALYFAKRTGRNRVIADEDVHGSMAASG